MIKECVEDRDEVIWLPWGRRDLEGEMSWRRGSVRVLSPPGPGCLEKCIPRLDTPLRTKPYRLGTHGSSYLANYFSRTIVLLSVHTVSEELLPLPWLDSCPGGRST